MRCDRRIRLALVVSLVLGWTAFSAARAQSVGAELKIGIIDVERIITESATGKSLLAELEKFGKEQQARLEGQRGEIDALQKRITDGGLSLAQDKLDQMKKELEDKTIALRRSADDAQREFNTRRDKAFQAIEQKVMPVIQQLGKEGKYSLIFRKFDSGLVYADESTEITQLVIERLDSTAGTN